MFLNILKNIVLKNALMEIMHTWLKDNKLDNSSWSRGWMYSKMEFPVNSTWDNPRCTEAVSEMYIIFPSADSTKINPSNVCKRWDPSSFIISGRLWNDDDGFCSPHPSPKPRKRYQFEWFLNGSMYNFYGCKSWISMKFFLPSGNTSLMRR